MSERSHELSAKSEKRKKRKMQSESNGEEVETRSEQPKKKKRKHSEPTNVEEDGAETEQTKKKKKKRRTESNEEEEAESKAEIRKEKKKLRVETSILTETPDRIAPVVGYFPSGYNPDESAEPPEIRVFRNSKHRSSQVEVVVNPKGSNVEFVGKSYEGEAAVHQPCQYALGVLDKETQTLKVVQIAGNRIFRLEPRVMNSASTEENTEDHKGDGLNAERSGRNIADLTSLFGTKKQRAVDKRMKLLAEQKSDPTAPEQLKTLKFEPVTNDEKVEDSKEIINQHLPPHNLSAVTPETAYPLDEIIPKAERAHLYDILEFLRSSVGENPTFWQDNYYPSFVCNRIHWLRSMQNEEEKTERAFTLSYITHLVNFFKLSASSGRRKSQQINYGDAINKYKIPRVIFQRFTNLFVDPASNLLASDKRGLLISYILVLTLFADKFCTDSSDIAKDLGMSVSDLKVYFRHLGCISKKNSSSNSYEWTLLVPLKIVSLTPARKRRQK